jgi:hypothetical protein
VWTWIWNCGDSSVETSSVTPSDQPGATWVWDWRWGCEDTPDAPAPGTNTAVSVRVFSPGDNGAVTQSNTTTSTSVATTASEIVQSATQTAAAALPVPPPSVMQPPSLPVMPPVVLPEIPAPAVPVPVVPVPAAPTVPTLDEILAAVGLIFASSGGNGSMSPGAAADVSDAGSFRPARRQGGMRRAPETIGAPSPGVLVPGAAALAATTQAQSATAADGHRAASATGAGRSARERPTWPQLPRAPFGATSDLSVASSAPGTGSPGTGIAILVGALLLFAPSLARWLRAAEAPRPRAPFVRRPDRPG